MLLFAAKLFVAWWITLISAIGVWLPVYYVRRGRDDVTAVAGSVGRSRRVAVSSTTKLCLSFANCLSAGMLLTMALLHFFPEALEGGLPSAAPGHTSLCFWMLVGILIPAVLERSMKGPGGHSHGVSGDAEVEHAYGSGPVTTSTLLLVLMCFHGMTEGLLLGFENKTASLLSAALPLSIHKFCDGLVIGVATAKEMYAQSEEECGVLTNAELPSDTLEKAGRSAGRFWRRLYQGPVGVWLLLTPITMIVVLMFAAVSRGGEATTTTGEPTSTLSAGTAAAGASSVSTLAAVQAIGSGSFVYIGLGILSGEELKGGLANAALLTGVALTGSLFVLSGHGE